MANFVNEDIELNKLRNECKLCRLIKDNDLDTCINVLRWVHEKLFSGEYLDCNTLPIARYIINYASEKKTIVNCFFHSIVLTQTLLSLGFKARTVTCLQSDGLPFDNHVVNEVYLSSQSKWILLDSTICCYFVDISGVPLSLIELRYKLINSFDIKMICKSRITKANNINFTSLRLYVYDTYIMILIRNLYMLDYYVENSSVHKNSQYIRLVPEVYLLDGKIKTLSTNGHKKYITILQVGQHTMRVFLRAR